MAELTLKIDTKILRDKSYADLSSDAKAVLFAIVTMCDADGGGVDLDDLEHVLRAKHTVPLRHLAQAGFVELRDDCVYALGKLIRRETRSAYHRERREKQRQRPASASPSPNPLQNQPALQPAPDRPQNTAGNQPAPAPQSTPADKVEKLDIFDGWLEPEDFSGSTTAADQVVVEKQAEAPAKPKKARKTAAKKQLEDSSFKPELLAAGMQEDLVDRFFEIRVAKKQLPMDRFDWEVFCKEAGLAGWTAAEAFEFAVSRKWSKIEAGWLAGKAKPGSSGLPRSADPLGIPEGYYKDGFGKLKKRQGGVVL